MSRKLMKKKTKWFTIPIQTCYLFIEVSIKNVKQSQLNDKFLYVLHKYVVVMEKALNLKT